MGRLQKTQTRTKRTKRTITKMSLMEVLFRDPNSGTTLPMPKGISIHIHNREDIVQMLVKDKLRGVKNSDYKNSDMYDLVLNAKDQDNNIRKDQGLVLLTAQMIANVCWLSDATGETHPIKTLRIIGERETMLIVGKLSSGWSMERVDPSYILDCLGNYITKDKE